MLVVGKNWRKKPKCPLTDGQIKQIVLHFCNEILRNKKKWTSEMSEIMGEYQNNWGERNKPDKKENTTYDSISIKF